MPLSKKRVNELKQLAARTIDCSDIPETDAALWAQARVKLPEPKEVVYLWNDPEVLRWFRKKGRGYQTRMHAVLRSYLEACKGRGAA